MRLKCHARKPPSILANWLNRSGSGSGCGSFSVDRMRYGVSLQNVTANQRDAAGVKYIRTYRRKRSYRLRHGCQRCCTSANVSRTGSPSGVYASKSFSRWTYIRELMNANGLRSWRSFSTTQGQGELHHTGTYPEDRRPLAVHDDCPERSMRAEHLPREHREEATGLFSDVTQCFPCFVR